MLIHTYLTNVLLKYYHAPIGTKFSFFRRKPGKGFFSLPGLINLPISYKLPLLWAIFFSIVLITSLLRLWTGQFFDSYKYPSNVILNQSRFHPQSGRNLSLHPFRDLNRLSYWNRRWSLFSKDSLLRFSGKKSPWPLFTSLSSSMSGNPRKCSASKPSNRMRMTQVMRRLERANIL